MVLYSDNAGVVFSVADFSLSSADVLAIDGSQLTRSHRDRLLLCSRSSLSSADSTVRQFQLTLALCSPFAQLRRSPLLNVFSRTYVASFLLQAISRHCQMHARIERIRVDTCANDGMPAGDTIGIYVSGRRGSLEPTIDRKRQLYRKFADYYSRSFGFARITHSSGLGCKHRRP